MAERQGFEPWIEFPLYTLSKRAPSTTRPSLRIPGASRECESQVYQARSVRRQSGLRVPLPDGRGSERNEESGCLAVSTAAARVTPGGRHRGAAAAGETGTAASRTRRRTDARRTCTRVREASRRARFCDSGGTSRRKQARKRRCPIRGWVGDTLQRPPGQTRATRATAAIPVIGRAVVAVDCAGAEETISKSIPVGP
jgi:hypothetical protein